MAGIRFTVFNFSVAWRMFSGNSSPLRNTNTRSGPEQQTKVRVLQVRSSHVNDQHRLPPVSVSDQVQQVLGVWGGDVQRVHDVKVVLEKHNTGPERESDLKCDYLFFYSNSQQVVTITIVSKSRHFNLASCVLF